MWWARPPEGRWLSGRAGAGPECLHGSGVTLGWQRATRKGGSPTVGRNPNECRWLAPDRREPPSANALGVASPPRGPLRRSGSLFGPGAVWSLRDHPQAPYGRCACTQLSALPQLGAPTRSAAHFATEVLNICKTAMWATLPCPTLHQAELTTSHDHFQGVAAHVARCGYTIWWAAQPRDRVAHSLKRAAGLEGHQVTLRRLLP